MKVALIGDVHGNYPALMAVLDHAESHGVETIWHVGDFVGYGAFPDQVVQHLRRTGALSIIGNYDRKVLKFKRKAAKWRRTKRPEKYLAFKWAYENLSPESREYLRTLSKQMRLTVEGFRILLVHGSPTSISEHLTPRTPEKRLRKLARKADADIVICGHSHHPFVRKVGKVWFINTGSVGRPEDGDARASYAIMGLKAGNFRARHYRVAYDVARAAAAIRRQRLPEAFAQMLIQAHNLDTILPTEEVNVTLSPLGAGGPEDSRLQSVLQLGERYRYGERHAHQVMRLALRLFDDLESLHGLGAKWRFRLQCAALLHEIGWYKGYEGHHETSLRIILDTPMPTLRRKERRLIGLIARYHRGPLPQAGHKHFSRLKPGKQHKVAMAAALLRVADGLDSTRRSVVRDLGCEIQDEKVTITCTGAHRGAAEQARVLEKGDLFERIFERRLEICWQLV